MLLKTRGIVFRALKYSETSIIADIYTEQKGLHSFIINGVRSKNTKTKASLFQLYSLLDLVVYFSEQQNLHRIKEVSPAYIYQQVPFDIRRGAVGMFMLEIAQKAIKEQEPNAPLFEFLFFTFAFLDKTTQSFANLHLFFMVRLSGFLGFLPYGEYTAHTPYFDLREGSFVAQPPSHADYAAPEVAAGIAQLLSTDFATLSSLHLSVGLRRQLMDTLITYYKSHIDYLTDIHSHTILQTIFE